MTAAELRQKYLDFFKKKGHEVIPSASLLPENDPTVLFTTAGMHPLVPYLLGTSHPAGRRLASVQKCLRTDDIDEVGDAKHHTFFEMLGNWSLGDYFKSEAVKWSWEFLTSSRWLGLKPELLAVSVFAGDKDAPFDQESYDLWRSLDIAEARLARLPKKSNWWEPAGQSGPCGPDTEIFYWAGDPKAAPAAFNDDNELWIEIWNNVFMEYNQTAAGKYEPLRQRNVDTGMGLERTVAVINGLDDDYRTELFVNLIKEIEKLSGQKYGANPETTRAMRIIADHIKAATFLMADDRGLTPSNTDQGYVIRRLIRRAVRYGRQLVIKEKLWTKEIAAAVTADYDRVYPELEKNQKFVAENLDKEEEKFGRTLEMGLQEFNRLAGGKISGRDAFDLYQSYGFPLEMTVELAKEKGVAVDSAGFAAELKQHQDLSRTAAAGKFKGGLADASEATTKLHTAAHLLLAALRRVLGDHVVQKGSNITPERLRLDFSHPEKMTAAQLRQVEDMVNGEIEKDWPVTFAEMTVAEAKTQGAMGVFASKYGEKVKVYTIDDFSKEICGGPHVAHTGALGRFRIQKEEASSAGVRRIKAILE